MHVFLENVRSEVEYLSGHESYLTCSVFWRIHREMDYEKDGREPLVEKEEFDRVTSRATEILVNLKNWDLRGEVLSWKTGMLRDLGRHFYHGWEKIFRERFLAPSKFQNGTPCLALEAFCEQADLDPTTLYVTLVDLLTVATRLTTGCNTAVGELEKITEFEEDVLAKDPANAFLNKRLEQLKSQAILTQCVKKLEVAADVCLKNSKYVKSNFFVVWSMAFEEIAAFLTALKTFFTYRKIREFEYELSKWIADMFPERFLDGRRNLLNESQLHHEIVNKLACSTKSLFLYVAKNDRSVFVNRDRLVMSRLNSIFRKQTRVEVEKRQFDEVEPLAQKLLRATSD